MHSLALSERPRERLLTHGPRALATAELVALVLGSGHRTASTLALAHRLLTALAEDDGDVRVHLRDASPQQLTAIAGIGPARAAGLVAAVELGRRVYLESGEPRPVLDSPQAVARVLAGELAYARQEQFAVLLLDVKNRLIARRVISLGTIDETIAHPREVFREAIRQGAAGVIVAHNHPSGQSAPSPEDLRLTEQLIACGRLLSIPVLDHVIVAAGEHTSLRRTTLLWQHASPAIGGFP
jgi:DNA repair protein RadC